MIVKTSDNVRIACCHDLRGHTKVVIIAPGFSASQDNVLLQVLRRHLLERYDVLMFDFRGHGRSSGLFTWTSREGEDLKAVLKSLEGTYDRIGLIGFSWGGSVCLNVLAADSHNVSSLICVSALSDPCRIDFRWWELDWENDVVYNMFSREGRRGKGVRPGPFWLPKTKPGEVVDRLRVPVLYVQGERDWTVAAWHAQRLFERTQAPKKLVMIKNGLHAEFLLRQHREDVLSAIDEWFSKTL